MGSIQTTELRADVVSGTRESDFQNKNGGLGAAFFRPLPLR